MPDLPVSQSAGDLAASAASISPSQMDVTMHIPEQKCRSEKLVVEAQETAAAEFSSLSLDDPGLWTHLSSSLRDFLVLHGPQQVKNFMFPKDHENRSFHPTHYWLEIPNGDKMERPWLMYSKTQNAAYCFCCKLFQPHRVLPEQRTGKIWLEIWHEKAANHQRAFQRWKELEMRLRLKATIDDQHQEKIASESPYWQNVLKRIIAIVRMLATQNLALWGTSDQLYVLNNGNFLKTVELMAEFDAVLQEHLRRVTTQEIYTHHYLGKTIQNEIIQLLATKVKQKIVADLKSARYYFVILDCTPDISHTEQMTLMVRFVTTTEPSENVPAMVTVREHFLEFIDIDDTTGAGMTNVLLKKLEDTGITIADMRGQGYDNGANMRGKIRGVQPRI
ncbi:zinc finger MYM-type protein 1-like [Natator depressus]|uniref:zinc finger MYM-type protein 1-like n=1 Tax=Natator depressus TaxID=27790 RepID=UPI003EBE59F7